MSNTQLLTSSNIVIHGKHLIDNLEEFLGLFEKQLATHDLETICGDCWIGVPDTIYDVNVYDLEQFGTPTPGCTFGITVYPFDEEKQQLDTSNDLLTAGILDSVFYKIIKSSVNKNSHTPTSSSAVIMEIVNQLAVANADCKISAWNAFAKGKDHPLIYKTADYFTAVQLVDNSYQYNIKDNKLVISLLNNDLDAFLSLLEAVRENEYDYFYIENNQAHPFNFLDNTHNHSTQSPYNDVVLASWLADDNNLAHATFIDLDKITVVEENSLCFASIYKQFLDSPHNPIKARLDAIEPKISNENQKIFLQAWLKWFQTELMPNIHYFMK